MIEFLTTFFAPLFEWYMPRPYSYGDWETSWFHYVTFTLIIILAVVLAKFYKDKPSHKVYRFVFIIGVFMVIFEGLRQLFFVWQSGGSYPWYVFPFQFCSTPIYLGVLIRFVPNKFKDTIMHYLASFALLAGILVMLLPNDIYIDSVYINFQTTFQHGMMIVIGLVALVRLKTLSLKAFLGPISIFATFIVLAVLLNSLHNEFIDVATFNMFYINPRYGTSLPVLITIYPLVPYLVFLMIYVLGFSLGAYLMISIKKMVLVFTKANVVQVKTKSPSLT